MRHETHLVLVSHLSHFVENSPYRDLLIRQTVEGAPRKPYNILYTKVLDRSGQPIENLHAEGVLDFH